MSEAKTLEAYFAQPTQHKERKLQQEKERYEKLLRRSFYTGCDTMTAVNDTVSGKDLNWHSKNALKNYVPDLLDEDTFDAKKLADDHPIRYANTAANFDHDKTRHHSICWEVPLPGRGTNFWIPLQINSSQEDWWHTLIDEDDESITVGEIRLQRDGSRWVLHVTANYEIEESPETDDRSNVTPVGVDVGESNLLVGCALQDGTPVDPLFVDGGRVRHLRQKQASSEDRLKSRGASKLLDEQVWGSYQEAIDDEVEKASTEAVEYAAQFTNPVIVLEYLEGITDGDVGKYWNRRLGKWLFSRLQNRIAEKAAERGIPVEYVHPHYTSKTCHACQHIGYRLHQGTFKCSNDACWVSEYQADLNAAVNIAQRLDPWGESLPVKSAGDDSPCGAVRNEAPVAEPQDSDRSEATLDDETATNEVAGESDNTVRSGAADDKVSSSPPAEGAGAEPETRSTHTS